MVCKEKEAIEKSIMESDPEEDIKADWTSLWAKRYPVLASYKEKIDPRIYENVLSKMLSSLEKEGLSRIDAFLVLKDILWRLYAGKK